MRAYFLTGFPWSSLGYSQHNFLSLIQISDITGVYGISFLLVAVNGAIADFFLMKIKKRDRPLYSAVPTISGLIFLSLILIFCFFYGTYKLSQQKNGPIVKVSVIQGNIEQDKKWEPLYQKEVVDTYKELSLMASKNNPDLIVWPETAVPFYFGKDLFWTSYLLNFQRNLNSYLLFGSVLVKEKKEDNSSLFYTNSAVLLDKNGNISYVYDKIHLVPFGEYVPLRNLLFFIEKITYGIGDYTSGQNYVSAVTPFGNFGTLICYEIIFPGLVRKFFVKEGDFIVTITNDAWFGDTPGPYQHFSMAVFRAIENRKPVIRAANTGISGFIDSSGRVISHSNLFEKSILTETIKTDRSKTFYTRYGDLFSYLCFVCVVLIIINGKKRR
jgi:apolipoprotein N-acyltransferase